MDWSIVVSVCRDEDVLESTLLRSPAVKRARQILCQRGYPTAAMAYNAAMRNCAQEIVVFTHPDVYLPEAWCAAFERSLEWLNRNDPAWGVAGAFGCTTDGTYRGFLYSTGQGGFVGLPFSQPSPVRTLDEFVFAVRQSSGLTFDEHIPGVKGDLCTTDLCLQAERRGLRCYALPCFALHNSNGWTRLPFGFWGCYLYLRRKWRDALPVYAPNAKLTAGCLPMVRSTVRGLIRRRGLRVVTRVADPSALYEQLRRDAASTLGAECGTASRVDRERHVALEPQL